MANANRGASNDAEQPSSAPSGVGRALDAGTTRHAFLIRTGGSVIAVSGLGSLLAACGGGDGDAGSPARREGSAGAPPATPTGTLRVGISRPTTLDQSLSTQFQDNVVIGSVFQTLTNFAPDPTEMVPSLATEWNDDEAREWTFKLRPGVTFHDGEPLDSQAVKKTMEYYQRSSAPFGNFYAGPFQTIDAGDPETVRLIFKDPFPDLLRYHAWGVGIFSPKQITDTKSDSRKLASSPVGTGPYRFERQSGGSILLTANPNYWGDGPYYEQIEFRIIDDKTAQVSALQAGDVDVIFDPAPSAARSIDSAPRTRTGSTGAQTTLLLDLACDRAPFDDVRVRQALAYAMDYEALIDKLYLGLASPVNSIMPTGAYGQREAKTQYTFDADRARTLLSEASQPERVPVNMTIYRSENAQLAQAIVGMMGEVGFDVTLRVLDDAVGVKDLDSPDRRYQIHVLSNGWIVSPYHIASGNITTHTRYDAKDLAQAIEVMNTVQDGPERLAAIGDAQDIIGREAIEIPLFQVNNVLSLADGVQGLPPSPTSIYKFDETYGQRG